MFVGLNRGRCTSVRSAEVILRPGNVARALPPTTGPHSAGVPAGSIEQIEIPVGADSTGANREFADYRGAGQRAWFVAIG